MQDTTDPPETRKLQRVGGGTYTVSIPKEWATEQSLSAGDRVHLYPDGDGSLVLCRDATTADPASATVAVDGEDCLEPVLSAAYAAGVERLVLTAAEEFSEQQRRTVERLVQDRTGMRVTDTSTAAITVHTFLDDGQVSVERSVVQLQFVALSLFRTAVDGVLDASAVDPDRVTDRRAEATRLRSLITRQFGRSLSRPSSTGDLAVDRSATFDLYRTAQALEGVAHASGAMATAVAAADRSSLAPDSYRPAADATRLFVENATAAVVDGADVERVQELVEEAKAVADAIAPLEAGSETACRQAVAALGDCHRHGQEIAAVAHQAALREGR